MMRYDYNATQILAVVAIIREMQTAIREVIFNKGRAEDQLSIFPERGLHREVRRTGDWSEEWNRPYHTAFQVRKRQAPL